MHELLCTVNGKQRPRTGAAYRRYADGRITNMELMAEVIAWDIVQIWKVQPYMRNHQDDGRILNELRQHFSNIFPDWEDFEYSLMLMALAYDFGFMRGENAMRQKINARLKK